MAEIASLVFAIVALLDSCLTVSKLAVTGKDFPVEGKALHLSLRGEEARLRTWAREWEIATDQNQIAESALTIPNATTALLTQEAENANVDLAEVRDILQNMWELLSEGKTVGSRQGLLGTSSNDPATFRKTIRDKVSTAISRIQWVFADKDRLRALVSYLKEHNDKLDRIRPQEKSSSLHTRQNCINCELLASIEAFYPNATTENLSQFPQLLQTLAMRQRHSDTEGGESQPLEISQWEYAISLPHNLSSPTRFLTTHKLRGPVMVEWKYYPSADPKTKSFSLGRVQMLVRQLRQNPAGFRVLNCVGWFQDPGNSRSGILYDVPTELDPGPGLRIVTLAELLESSKGKLKPALGERFALAKILANAILEFHMSFWLHKDFNSSNVIFFREGGDRDEVVNSVRIRSPYIASFGLSRPDHDVPMSELVPTASHSLDSAYHHPAYQYPTVGQARDPTAISRFHRAFDVYSLGCVLLEIGAWSSLKSFGWNGSYQTDLAKWRSALKGMVKQDLAYIAGQIYADVVMTCLNSDLVDSDLSKESERVRDFCWGIVRKLDSLRA
ncbi:MAG: hypothetical protein M1839_006935 [Geoglossum umbratile]|nr:MAG: hypothetical protein M1839_006935 [Geoglossum umbratile]